MGCGVTATNRGGALSRFCVEGKTETEADPNQVTRRALRLSSMRLKIPSIVWKLLRSRCRRILRRVNHRE